MVKRSSLLLLLALLTSCATVSNQPRLTAAEVTQLADAAARHHDYDLRLYRRPEIHYNYVRKDNVWVAFYDEKSVNGMVHIGLDFTVYIDDRTKKLWLIPGR